MFYSLFLSQSLPATARSGGWSMIAVAIFSTLVISSCQAAVLHNKIAASGPYRPVILIHGIMADAASLFYLRDYITKAHPGTEIIDTDLFSTGLSLVDMWTQVNVIGALVKNVSDNNPNGFHILGDSQGGIVVRGILQKFDNLNVHTFISMSSPQNGQFGDDALKWFPGWAKEDLHFVLYTPIGQKFSIGGYWRDPHQIPAFEAHNIYLPVLNNQSTTHGHDSHQFKQNFLRIQRLVLIGGPDDGTITPYQSAFFGTYDENEKVVPVEETDLYINDQFGLRTLMERKAVHVHNISGVVHVDWQTTDSVLDAAVLPYLD